MLANLAQDVRYALRTLLQNPVFTTVAVVTLALGIGVNAAIFTVVDATLLRPLPYPAPERLMHVWETRVKDEGAQEMNTSYPNLLDYQARAKSFESIAGYTSISLRLVRSEGSQMVQVTLTSGSFFDMLKVKPAMGRLYGPDDDLPGAEKVVVLSHGGWQRYFGGDTSVVGRTIDLEGAPRTIIGVLPSGFQFALAEAADIWTTHRPNMPPGMLVPRNLRWVRAVGRLAPGVAREAAQAELAGISETLATEHPDSNGGVSTRLVPLQDQVVGPLRPLLLVMLGAVGLVLLIACGNVANLLLARATARHGELAVRLALGASRGRLVQQLLTESLLLALLGGVAGLLCAKWGLELLLAAIPAAQFSTMPYLRDLQLNWQVLAFTLAMSVFTGVLFGLAPAVVSTQPDLQSTLKGQAQGMAGGARGRLRQALVVGEVALALVLLVGAGLLLKSLTRMMAEDPGFDRENLVVMDVMPPPGKYQEDHSLSQLHAQLVTRAEALPGVMGAAFTSRMPLSGQGNTIRYVVEGQPSAQPGEESEAHLRSITPNYFRILSVPLVRGRAFAATDETNGPRVVSINETLAKRLFPGQDPVGQHLRLSLNGEQKPHEIVGVVGDERMAGLDTEPPPTIYTPDTQNASTRSVLVLRMRPGATSVASALRAEMRAEDADLVLSGARTMEELVATAPWMFLRRYPTLVVGVFAAVALLLAMVGVYGVMAYSLSQRSRELAVRMALGARSQDVLAMVVWQGASLALLGVGLGLVGALALGRVLQRVLFGVSAADPVVLAGSSAMLVLMAALASYLPALRASRVPPASALR
ncbi:ABC transporter permease [Myxococcus vastator]|uniref:ABC transporter permease n=1 Tax=Myxococcus vastator TaxID=2709664 RepID=UPI0013D6CD9C|nr:ABC transporter permease [Myxococcus vastator]